MWYCKNIILLLLLSADGIGLGKGSVAHLSSCSVAGYSPHLTCIHSGRQLYSLSRFCCKEVLGHVNPMGYDDWQKTRHIVVSNSLYSVQYVDTVVAPIGLSLIMHTYCFSKSLLSEVELKDSQVLATYFIKYLVACALEVELQDYTISGNIFPQVCYGISPEILCSSPDNPHPTPASPPIRVH